VDNQKLHTGAYQIIKILFCDILKRHISKKNFKNMLAENKINILHIEDNPLDAFLIKKLLDNPAEDIQTRVNRYDITQVENLSSGLREILDRKETYNLVLLDLNLPDGNGTSNIEAIREINPDIAIVVMTSLKNEQIAMDSLRYGAQECLIKENGNSEIVKRIIRSSIYRKKAEIELAQKAYYDDLTGLPNRLFFHNSALNIISHAKRWKRRDALMFIDLNKFKMINDTCGHQAGNQVLKETAKRLKDTLRDSDLIARYAGDEFVVYMDNGRQDMTEELCRTVSEKIITSVEKPIQYEGQQFDISLSIGIAFYPDSGMDFDSLLSKADAAMYKAKNCPNKKFHIIQ
jgi:diguanylate cyclase (GGDEF)-like protein